MTIDSQRLREAFEQARDDLLSCRQAQGFWEGHLGSSPLATAVAVSALAVVRRSWTSRGLLSDEEDRQYTRRICGSLRWLAARQNGDGGWGDTDRSGSSLPATMLVVAAFQLTGVPAEHEDLLARAQDFVQRAGGVAGLRKSGSADRLAVSLILTNCALAETVSWREAGPVPLGLRGWLTRLVSRDPHGPDWEGMLAAAAARFAHHRPRNPLVRWFRRRALDMGLQRLGTSPATLAARASVVRIGFVVMGLAAAGRGDHSLVGSGVNFLLDTVRPDGSWALDPSLSVSQTAMAIEALCRDGQVDADDVASVDWILARQKPESGFKASHRANPAEREGPGVVEPRPAGWGSSDRHQGLANSADTSAALLALARFFQATADPVLRVRIAQAAASGCAWLGGQQNADGGWPLYRSTAVRSRSTASSPDLTASALRALAVWRDPLRSAALHQSESWDLRLQRGWEFLKRTQASDGHWRASWWADPSGLASGNSVLGTAQVLQAYQQAYRQADRREVPEVVRGLDALADRQGTDGSWGGCGQVRPSISKRPVRRSQAANRGRSAEGSERADRSGIEETAWAVDCLLAGGVSEQHAAAARRGLLWLVSLVEQRRCGEPSCVGLVPGPTAYYDWLLPRSLCVAALGAALRDLPHSQPTASAGLLS